MRAPIALTIAGSDPSGGAGIQADLKTFSALGAYGASVITALTAQNTQGVRSLFAIDAGFVGEQIDAVMEDLDVDAVKIGMLGTAEVIDIVAERLRAHQPRWVVVDPVMVAKSGHRLLADDAVTALRDRLLPLASLVTPNLPEAADLLGIEAITNRSQMANVGARLQGFGVANVLVKGGHLDADQSPDLLLAGGENYWFEAARTHTQNTHGTGCTLSAAIAAGLARGLPLPQAVGEAKSYVARAIGEANGLGVGKGRGPVHHFHNFWTVS